MGTILMELSRVTPAVMSLEVARTVITIQFAFYAGQTIIFTWMDPRRSVIFANKLASHAIPGQLFVMTVILQQIEILMS